MGYSAEVKYLMHGIIVSKTQLVTELKHLLPAESQKLIDEKKYDHSDPKSDHNGDLFSDLLCIPKQLDNDPNSLFITSVCPQDIPEEKRSSEYHLDVCLGFLIAEIGIDGMGAKNGRSFNYYGDSAKLKMLEFRCAHPELTKYGSSIDVSVDECCQC